MTQNSVGSIWRIWDLQVQTILDDQYVELKDYYEEIKKEKPELWRKFVSKVGGEENALLFDSKAYVFNAGEQSIERYNDYARTFFSYLETFKPHLGLIALTDHNYYHNKLIDVLYKYSQKTFCKCICGVEVNASGVHMLVYFERPPFEKDNFSEGIKTFLDSIEINKPKQEDGVLSVSNKSVTDVISKVDKANGLYLFPHCNSDNGLFQERGKTDRTHLANIFNHKPTVFLQSRSKAVADKTKFFISSHRHLFKSEYLFSISKDSRRLEDIGASDENGNYTWVKADCHFKGLNQILIEKDRVTIDEEPELVKRVKNNPTKFLASLSIKKVDGVVIDDNWFNDFHIELNSGLVAIIGNKGAGKSAITDILGLCGNTHQDPSNFSFLTSSKFRKLKPLNLSEKFEAEIVWKDGTVYKRTLDQNPDRKLPERVRYIPQNFLEKLCTNVESEDFEREIKQIIFSHTPIEYRLGKSSLDELINYKSNLVIDEINKIKSAISKINIKIIELEDKSSEGFRTEVQNAINLKKNELDAHLKIKPERPPSIEDRPTSDLTNRIASLREAVEKFETQIEEIGKTRQEKIENEEQVKQSLQYFINLKEMIDKMILDSNPMVQTLIKNGIDRKEVFSYQINLTLLEDLLGNIQRDIQVMNNSLNENLSDSISFKRRALLGEIKELQDQLERQRRSSKNFLIISKFGNNKKRLSRAMKK